MISKCSFLAIIKALFQHNLIIPTMKSGSSTVLWKCFFQKYLATERKYGNSSRTYRKSTTEDSDFREHLTNFSQMLHREWS